MPEISLNRIQPLNEEDKLNEITSDRIELLSSDEQPDHPLSTSYESLSPQQTKLKEWQTEFKKKYGPRSIDTETALKEWQTEFKKKYGPRSIDTETARGFFEYGGLTAGGMVGMASPVPAGTFIGAGLGYAGGKKIADILEEMGGYKNPEDLPKQLIQTAKDVGVGALLQASGDVLGALTKSGIEITPRIINAVRKHLPALTEKGAAFRVGSKLAAQEEKIAADKLAQESIKKVEQIKKEIPRFQTTLGQASNIPSIIQQERTFLKGTGAAADINSEMIVKNNKAIQAAYEKVMKGGNPDELIKLAQERDVLMKGATGRLSAGQTTQELGGGLSKQIGEAAQVSKTAHEEAYAAIGEVSINPAPIQTVIADMGKKITSVNAGKYPVSTISDINNLLQSQNQLDDVAMKVYGMKWEQLTDNSKKILVNSMPELKETTGVLFKDWHSISKRLSSEYWDAIQGINPNRELARNIKIIQKGVEEALEQSTKGTPAEGAYQKAVSLFKDYADKFYKGAIGRVRQKGMEVTGLKIAQAEIPSQFATADGADSLIAAIGKDNAKIAMRDYYNNELANVLKGDISPEKIARWVIDKSRKSVLEKYGLYDEFKNLINITKDAVMVKKILGVAPKDAVQAALGQGLNMNVNAAKLMNMAKGNPQAEAGIQRAVGDFILNKVETTAADRAGSATLSNAKLVNVIDKFKPALDRIYVKNPEKLKMLQTIQEAVEVMGRNVKSPTGGGSDTFELTGPHFSGLMRYIGNRFGAAALGAGAGATMGSVGAATGAATGMIGWDILNYYSKQKINRFMIKALVDGDFAQTLVMMAKGANKEIISKRVAQQMATLELVHLQQGKTTDYQEQQEETKLNFMIDTTAIVERTGQKVKVKENADEALKNVNSEIEKYKKLLQEMDNQ